LRIPNCKVNETRSKHNDNPKLSTDKDRFSSQDILQRQLGKIFQVKIEDMHGAESDLIKHKCKRSFVHFVASPEQIT
jgi:hypothetical protein